MRALHLIKTSVGATWALCLAKELARLGVDVDCAIPAGAQLVEEYRRAGVTPHLIQTHLPVKMPWRWWQCVRSFRRLVDEICPDIIHSHFVGTTLTMRLALGKDHPTPRVFQVPGPLHLEHGFFARGEIATAGRSDDWIASCEWTRQEYIRRGVPSSRVFLSYYGLDIDAFVRSAAGKLRKELGVGAACRLVGMVAYMYSPKRHLGQRRGLKGHEDFIDAMAICCKRRNDLVGVVIGGAWNKAIGYEQSVQEYARKRLGDCVRFLGTRNDVNELYGDLDVAVHPSHSENVGGARESLLLGVPTVATRVGGFPDLVIPGETGWLAPAKNPAALAEAILEALDDPQRAAIMARRGQERARELFDIRTTAGQILRIYEQILSR